MKNQLLSALSSPAAIFHSKGTRMNKATKYFFSLLELYKLKHQFEETVQGAFHSFAGKRRGFETQLAVSACSSLDF